MTKEKSSEKKSLVDRIKFVALGTALSILGLGATASVDQGISYMRIQPNRVDLLASTTSYFPQSRVGVEYSGSVTARTKRATSRIFNTNLLSDEYISHLEEVETYAIPKKDGSSCGKYNWLANLILVYDGCSNIERTLVHEFAHHHYNSLENEELKDIESWALQFKESFIGASESNTSGDIYCNDEELLNNFNKVNSNVQVDEPNQLCHLLTWLGATHNPDETVKSGANLESEFFAYLAGYEATNLIESIENGKEVSIQEIPSSLRHLYKGFFHPRFFETDTVEPSNLE